jgi:hypothetical protein
VNVGSLFAGIGGFDLGLQRAGMRVAWKVELDPYCQAVLARHFPEARRYEDVRDIGAENLAPVDLICVARSTAFPRAFRWPFRHRFRRPFPIRSGRRGVIRHRFTDRGGSVLPTSPRPIEVWS